MRPLRSTSTLLVGLAFALGCSSDEPKKPAIEAPGATPDTPNAKAIVFLRGRTSSDAAVAMDVVARGVEQGIHGAAFRLHWDPAKLEFDAAHASDAWSRQALLLAKEGAPGELVVAWTEKGGGRRGERQGRNDPRHARFRAKV